MNVTFSPTTVGAVTNGTFTVLLASGEQVGDTYWDAITNIVITMPSAGDPTPSPFLLALLPWFAFVTT